ncbi:MAG: DEAD/DEAH box helicase family protein [Spirochaetales bacterium]|nr:DEAD/DEAH box helicase family protein [Spirochaetales bacterium]
MNNEVKTAIGTHRLPEPLRTLGLSHPSLKRLNSLGKTDPGLYALALHCFVESQARADLPQPTEFGFRTLIVAWWQHVLSSSPHHVTPETQKEARRILSAVIRHHASIREVRRNFIRMSQEELRCAIWDIIRLGDFMGWSTSPEITGLKQQLLPWTYGITLEQDSILQELQEDMTQNDSHENSDFTQVNTALLRLVQCSRSRRDFTTLQEQLNSSQEEALQASIHEKAVFLHGEPGTGKTHVLLQALFHTAQDHHAPPSLFLTASRGLAFEHQKTLEQRHPGFHGNIQVHKQYLFEKLRHKEPFLQIELSLLESVVREHGCRCLSPMELVEEIELGIFGTNVTRDVYIEQGPPLPHRGAVLSHPQREKIWNLRELVEEIMVSRCIYSPVFSRKRLLSWIQNQPNEMFEHRKVFLDDSQVLLPIDKECFMGLTQSHLVMSHTTTPWSSANHSNSMPSYQFSTNYRSTDSITHFLHQQWGEDSLSPLFHLNSQSPRTGPRPRREQSSHCIERMAIRARHYISQLDYAPSEVAILSENPGICERIMKQLNLYGLETCHPNDEKGNDKTVRLGHVNAFTGMEFPIVFVLHDGHQQSPNNPSYGPFQFLAYTRAQDILEVYENCQS